MPLSIGIEFIAMNRPNALLLSNFDFSIAEFQLPDPNFSIAEFRCSFFYTNIFFPLAPSTALACNPNLSSVLMAFHVRMTWTLPECNKFHSHFESKSVDLLDCFAIFTDYMLKICFFLCFLWMTLQQRVTCNQMHRSQYRLNEWRI